ncbi:MAG: flavodoxin [Sporomusaceae bacterium]|nr:flavodoxin [Sporomusaceae bacterium]
MKTIAVVYWSGTGNTKSMAEAVAAGAAADGIEVKLWSVDEASLNDVVQADGIALGCPSMGSEVLEESEMEPFVAALEANVAGKPVVLFGSYGWGDGQWMRDWAERMEAAQAKLPAEGLIQQDAPDAACEEACKELGGKLAAAIA